jgi:hypothetical protein
MATLVRNPSADLSCLKAGDEGASKARSTPLLNWFLAYGDGLKGYNRAARAGSGLRSCPAFTKLMQKSHRTIGKHNVFVNRF